MRLPTAPVNDRLPFSLTRREALRLISLGLLGPSLPSLLSGCGSDDPHAPLTYEATIAESRLAVHAIMAETGATAVSLAFFDREGILWSEAFGQADQETGRAATTATLFRCASLSKLAATIATLILADRGQLSLDAPLADYLGPEVFSMPEDERYRDISIRMLLNHSSGLPGNEDRDGLTAQPFTGYAAQMMAGLRYQRLKHAPGALCAYNNDGFTLIENLVAAVSGVDYPTFVQQEIFDPLEMRQSQYQDIPLPPDRAVKSYVDDVLQPDVVINVYGSGGICSTPEDFAQIGRLFLNDGLGDSSALLSPTAVLSTGEDQTLGTFNPVPCEAYRYGLGWDTMAQPGLTAVGVMSWQKTGDFSPYTGTNLLVLPDEGLGAVVFGTSNGFTSQHAVQICERILISALVEKGRLSAMPTPLSQASQPKAEVPGGDRSTYSGYYASSSALYRLSYDASDALLLEQYTAKGWSPLYQHFRLRDDGWFAADDDPVLALKPLTSEGRRYLARRQNLGMGHYATLGLIGQQIERRDDIVSIWRTVYGEETWLPVNSRSLASFLDARPDDPRASFTAIPDLPDYLLGIEANVLRNRLPPSDTWLDGMFLYLPFAGQHIKEAAIESWQGEQWLRSGSWLYRPLSGLPAVTASVSVPIVPEGFAEWRRLGVAGSLSISNATAWLIYDANFVLQRAGRGDSLNIRVSAGHYLLCYGEAGGEVQLRLS